MIRVLFVCHGNICRSPMAEFVLKNMLKQKGISTNFYVASAATSREELGNPPHSGTKRKLREHGIYTNGKYAVQLTKSDYNKYDYLIGMEGINIQNMLRIVGDDPYSKLWRLLDFTDTPGNIDDPWYTGDFETTYQEVYKGCECLLEHINLGLS